MQNNARLRRKPNISISKTDHTRLSALAEAVAAAHEKADEAGPVSPLPQ